MESDPTLMCELLVGLGEVDVVGINDDGRGLLWVTVRSRSSRPVCAGCAGPVWSKGDRPVRLVDLPVFGRPVRLWWRKRRWMFGEISKVLVTTCVLVKSLWSIAVSRWSPASSSEVLWIFDPSKLNAIDLGPSENDPPASHLTWSVFIEKKSN